MNTKPITKKYVYLIVKTDPHNNITDILYSFDNQDHAEIFTVMHETTDRTQLKEVGLENSYDIIKVIHFKEGSQS